MLDWIFVGGGLIALFVGGESLVRGAVGIARKLAIPPLLIGLTVVGFGTSTPELLVSVGAALRGAPDIAVGNIVGSNIGNILLIVGLTALIWPIRLKGMAVSRDVAVMIAATLALVPVFWMGVIGRPAGAILVAALLGFLLWAYLKPGEMTAEDDAAPIPPIWKSVLWTGFGLGGLMLGAQYLVEGAVNIARAYGMSEAFIGLTIVAIGTSLPELATSLIAAVRRQSEIAIGNVIGSNIFNVLGILGVTAIIAPIPVADRFLTFDLPIMLAATCVFAGLLLRPQLGRGVGAVFLLAYAAYVWSAQG